MLLTLLRPNLSLLDADNVSLTKGTYKFASAKSWEADNPSAPEILNRLIKARLC